MIVLSMEQSDTTRSSGFIIAEAERRFPVRIHIGNPDGLGSRLDRIKAWLDENCGATDKR